MEAKVSWYLSREEIELLQNAIFAKIKDLSKEINIDSIENWILDKAKKIGTLKYLYDEADNLIYRIKKMED